MKLQKVLGLPLMALLTVSAVAAQVWLYGSVVAELLLPQTIEVGQIKTDEEFVSTLAVVNQTITDSVNVSVVCLGYDIISLKLTKPLGSDAPSAVELASNGTTVVNEQGKKLEVGNLTMRLRGLKQGIFNCSIEPQVTNHTVLIWTSG